MAVSPSSFNPSHLIKNSTTHNDSINQWSSKFGLQPRVLRFSHSNLSSRLGSWMRANDDFVAIRTCEASFSDNSRVLDDSGGGSDGGEGRLPPNDGGGGGGDDENGDEEEFGLVMKFDEVIKETEKMKATLPSDIIEAAKTTGIRKLLLTRYLELQVFFLGVSSNTRYQIINGLERIVEASPMAKKVPPVALAFTVGVRFANNIYGGMQFVDWARWSGVQ